VQRAYELLRDTEDDDEQADAFGRIDAAMERMTEVAVEDIYRDLQIKQKRLLGVNKTEGKFPAIKEFDISESAQSIDTQRIPRKDPNRRQAILGDAKSPGGASGDIELQELRKKENPITEAPAKLTEPETKLEENIPKTIRDDDSIQIGGELGSPNSGLASQLGGKIDSGLLSGAAINSETLKVSLKRGTSVDEVEMKKEEDLNPLSVRATDAKNALKKKSDQENENKTNELDGSPAGHSHRSLRASLAPATPVRSNSVSKTNNKEEDKKGLMSQEKKSERSEKKSKAEEIRKMHVSKSMLNVVQSFGSIGRTGEGKTSKSTEDTKEYFQDCLDWLFCENVDDEAIQQVRSLQQLLLSKFVFTVIRTTLMATSEMIPRSEIPTLLSNHSTYSAKLEESRTKLYKFWLDVMLQQSVESSVQTLREMLMDRMALNDAHLNSTDLLVRKKKARKMKRLTSFYGDLGDNDTPIIQLGVMMLKVLDQINEDVGRLINWFRPFNRNRHTGKYESYLRHKKDRAPNVDEIRELRQLRTHLGALTFKLVMFADPSGVVKQAEDEDGLGKDEPPRDRLIQMIKSKESSLESGVLLSRVEWGEFKGVQEVPIQRRTHHHRRKSRVDREAVSLFKVQQAMRTGGTVIGNDRLISPVSPGGGGGGSPFEVKADNGERRNPPSRRASRRSHHRRRSSLTFRGANGVVVSHRRSSIGSVNADLPEVGDDTGSVYSTTTATSQSSMSRISGILTNPTTRDLAGDLRHNPASFDTSSTSGSSWSDPFGSNSHRRRKSFGGSVLPDRRLRTVLKAMAATDLQVAGEEDLVLFILKGFDISMIPEESYERRQFMAAFETELAGLLRIHIDRVEVREIRPHRINKKNKAESSVKVYVCLYYAIQRNNGEEGGSDTKGKVDRVFRALLLQNRDELLSMRFNGVRQATSALCDELLNLLVKLAGGKQPTALSNHGPENAVDFVTKLGVVDPATYINNELLLDFSNSTKTKASDWIKLQTGVGKLVDDFKFNVSVRKSGTEGVEVHPRTEDGTSFLAIPRKLRFYDKEFEERTGLCDCLFDKPTEDLDDEEDEERTYPVYFQVFQGDKVTYKIVLRNTFRNIKMPSSRTLVDVQLVSHHRTFWGNSKTYDIKDPVPRVRLTYPATVCFIVPPDLPTGFYTVRLLINGLPMRRVEKVPRDADKWDAYIDAWAKKKLKQRRAGIWNIKVDHPLEADRWKEIGGDLQFVDDWDKRAAVTRREYDVYVTAPARGGIFEVVLRLRRSGVKALRENSHGHEDEGDLGMFEDVDYITISDTRDDRSLMLSGMAIPNERDGTDRAKYEIRLNLAQAEAGTYQMVIKVDGEPIHFQKGDVDFQGAHDFDIMMGEPLVETFKWSEKPAELNDYLVNLTEQNNELAFGYPFRVMEQERKDRLASVDFMSAVVKEVRTRQLDYAIVEKESRLEGKNTHEEIKNDCFICYFHPLIHGKYQILLFMHKPVKYESGITGSTLEEKEKNYRLSLQKGEEEWQQFRETKEGELISRYWQRNQNGTFTQRQTNFSSIHMPIAMRSVEVRVHKSHIKQIRESMDNVVEARTEEVVRKQESSRFASLLIKAGVNVEGGHTTPILCMLVAESSVGKVLYTGGNAELCVWDLQNGKLVQCLYSGATAIAQHLDTKRKDEAKHTVQQEVKLKAKSDKGAEKGSFVSIRYFFTGRADGSIALYIQEETSMKLKFVQSFPAHRDSSVIGLAITKVPEMRVWSWGKDRFIRFFTLSQTTMGIENTVLSNIIAMLKKQKRLGEFVPSLERLHADGGKVERQALLDTFRSCNILLKDAKVLKSGWLNKRGGVKADKAFRKRWFQLMESKESKELLLGYYPKEAATNPLGLLHLKLCDIELSDQIGVFDLQTKIILGEVEKLGRRYVLRAKDDEERHDWVSTIRDLEFKNAKARAKAKKEGEENENKKSTNGQNSNGSNDSSESKNSLTAEQKKKSDVDHNGEEKEKKKRSGLLSAVMNLTKLNKGKNKKEDDQKALNENDPEAAQMKRVADGDSSSDEDEEEDELTAEKVWPVDYEAFQVVWSLGTRKFEPKARTKNMKRVVEHFFVGVENGDAVIGHLQKSFDENWWRKNEATIRLYFSYTYASEFVRLTERELLQRMGECHRHLAIEVSKHIRTLGSAVERKGSAIGLDIPDDDVENAIRDTMLLHKNFREGLRVRVRSQILQVELTKHPSYVAYVLTKDLRVYMIDRRMRRVDNRLSLQTGNFGTPYGMASNGEEMKLPKWLATLNKDGFRIHRVSLGSTMLSADEDHFVRGESRDGGKDERPSVAFEQLCGRVIRRVDYEAYEPDENATVRYYRGMGENFKRKYRRKNLWWIGTRRLEGKGSLLYAVDMNRLELNPWHTFENWAGGSVDLRDLQKERKRHMPHRKCPDPVGEIIEKGEVKSFEFTKLSGGLKNITTIYSPAENFTQEDFLEANLIGYYERLVQNSIFLGFDDGSVAWCEFAPGLVHGKKGWKWQVMNFPEAHARNENGRHVSVDKMTLILEENFRPFLISKSGSQPLKWDISDPSSITINKDLRPAGLSTRMMAWGTFLFENYQMISFGFASDFFWPPREGTDWFFEIAQGINLDLELGSIAYLIVCAVFSSTAMILFLVCYFFYNTKSMTDAFAHCAQTGETPWLGYAHQAAAIFSLVCTLFMMNCIKGIAYIFNCAENNGAYYHRMIGDGTEAVCFDPSGVQFWLMWLAIPVVPFFVYCLRLRRIEGEMTGLPSSLKARASWLWKGWSQDVRPSTQYHTLVPNEDSTLYPAMFALIRVVYGVLEVILLHLPFVKAALLASGSLILLAIALTIPPYAEIYANNLNVTCIACFLWTNIIAFINIYDSTQNNATGGQNETTQSDGETIVAAQSQYIAGIIIFYLLGIWLILMGFPGLEKWYPTMYNIVPPIFDLANRFYTWKEKRRRAKLRAMDMERRNHALEEELEEQRLEMERRLDVGEELKSGPSSPGAPGSPAIDRKPLSKRNLPKVNEEKVAKKHATEVVTDKGEKKAGAEKTSENKGRIDIDESKKQADVHAMHEGKKLGGKALDGKDGNKAQKMEPAGSPAKTPVHNENGPGEGKQIKVGTSDHPRKKRGWFSFGSKKGSSDPVQSGTKSPPKNNAEGPNLTEVSL